MSKRARQYGGQVAGLAATFAAGESGGAAAVTASLCLPGISPNRGMVYRLADKFNTKKTAIAPPFFEDKVNWNNLPANAVATRQQLPPSQMMIFLFRSFLRNWIRYNPNAQGQLYAYNWVFKFNDDESDNFNFPVEPGGITKIRPCSASDANLSTNTTVLHPHDDRLWALREDSDYYCWQDGVGTAAGSNTTYIRVIFFNAAGTAIIPETGTTIAIWYWRDGQRQRDQYAVGVATTITTVNQFLTTGGSAAGVAFPLSHSEYYGVEIGTVAGTLVSYVNIDQGDIGAQQTIPVVATPVGYGPLVAQSNGNGSSSWGHHAIPDLEQNLQSLDMCRILGTSILFKNEASPLNQQGNIVAAEIAQNESWTRYGYASGYSKIQDRADAFSNVAAKGFYGFPKFGDDKDFQFVSPVLVGAGGAVMSNETIRPRSPFIVMAVDVTIPQGCDFMMRIEEGTGSGPLPCRYALPGGGLLDRPLAVPCWLGAQTLGIIVRQPTLTRA